MKTWYYCVCDGHREIIDLFVDTPTSEATQTYMKDFDQQIFDWLKKHYGCDLRLIQRDDQLDKLHFEEEAPYKKAFQR